MYIDKVKINSYKEFKELMVRKNVFSFNELKAVEKEFIYYQLKKQCKKEQSIDLLQIAIGIQDYFNLINDATDKYFLWNAIKEC